MAFSGELEHLSIVDVIQLLHTTRKTGTLKVSGRKGDITIAFNDGYIIGASHYERGARIGTILVEAGVITAEALSRALDIQNTAGDQRKPLIATLLENGLADHEGAYRGLEALIELSIVEILTWKKGHFELLVDEIRVCDEFRYLPEKLNEEITLPTEHVLMDALRIFDEKMRDGLLKMEDDQSDEPSAAQQDEASSAASSTISADDLGLSDLGEIKRKIPGVFEAIKDYGVSAPGGGTTASDATAVFKQAATRLQKATSLPEIALIVMETAATQFPRALTLVVWDQELVAERGIGISVPGKQPGAVLGFKIPHPSGSLCSFVLDKGRLFFGKSDDQALREHLYRQIGAPADPTVFLLPLKVGTRIVSLIYADFGSEQPTPPLIEQLQSCAEHAGLTAESVLMNAQRTPTAS